MFNWRSHPDEGQLLHFCEGELPSRHALRIENHIRGCWECRTHIDDARRTIAGYVHYRNEVLRPGVPPPPAPWTGLDREFQKLRDAEVKTASFTMFRRPLGWILAGALAASAAGIVLTRPHPRLAPALEIRKASPVFHRDPQPAPAGRIPQERPVNVPEVRIGPAEELTVVAALHRIGADLGDPVEVIRGRDRIVIRGAGVEPERIAQLRAAVAFIPHVEVEVAAPAPPDASSASPVSVDSGRSAPVRDEIARQFGDHVAFQKFADQTMEASEQVLARAHALRTLADRFPANVEAQMSAASIAQLASIRQDHAAGLTESAGAIRRSLMPVLQSLGVMPKSETQPQASNWQMLASPLLSTAERVDQLIGTIFAATTGSSLDSLSTQGLAEQLAGALRQLDAETASFERLSADGQTRGGR